MGHSPRSAPPDARELKPGICQRRTFLVGNVGFIVEWGRDSDEWTAYRYVYRPGATRYRLIDALGAGLSYHEAVARVSR